jgi:hypothetical protein
MNTRRYLQHRTVLTLNNLMQQLSNSYHMTVEENEMNIISPGSDKKRPVDVHYVDRVPAVQQWIAKYTNKFSIIYLHCSFNH